MIVICQPPSSIRGKLTFPDALAATFMVPGAQPEAPAGAGAGADARDLLERLMIAFKYISAELDPYIAQVLLPPSLCSRATMLSACLPACLPACLRAHLSARWPTDHAGLDCMQERIIQECCTLLQCDRASLFLIDGTTGGLELQLGKGVDKIHIPKGAGIAGHVAETGEILNVPDPYSDPRFNKQTDKDSGYLTKSILCVPVRDGNGKTIAVLQAINKLNGATFSSDDQMVLEKLTMLAGISLRNAQLFEDSELQKNKVQSLLDVIRTMSTNMGLNSIIFTITQRFPGDL
jgi:putative methionine-R-sulfoxide reductase with GAF domain